MDRQARGTGAARWLRRLGQLLLLLGCGWFLLPLLRGTILPGAWFGFFVCLFGLFLLGFGPRLWAGGGWRRGVTLCLSVLYAAGMLWAAVLTGLMLSAAGQTPPPGKTLIVLGSQVFSAERPGTALSLRLDAACAYLGENPDSRVIVTGGQGRDEPCSEALTARNVLIGRGIQEDRILMEERSTSTEENLRFALETASEAGLTGDFVLVTQGFHQYRALWLARDLAGEGNDFSGLTAPTEPLYLPGYYGRELLALTWTFVRSIF